VFSVYADSLSYSGTLEFGSSGQHVLGSVMGFRFVQVLFKVDC
jgi:hypothetical protein